MKPYGLIGKSLGHSFSPRYFADKFTLLGITDASYKAFELSDLSQLRGLISKEHLLGFSVTLPYKEQIIPMLNSLSYEAGAIGAVNTVKVLWKGNDFELVGFNTDEWGFRKAIKPFLEAHHHRALILGTGGSSKAVAYVLHSLGIEFLYVSRNANHSKRIIGYADLSTEILTHYPFIVNCTPLGMYPDVKLCPELPYNQINPRNFLFDLTYNPPETLFLQKGRERGALVRNGLDMLKHQADKAWEIWNS